MTATVLGFDYGQRFIGIAVGQTLTGSCRALKSIIVPTGGELPWKEIEALCAEWQPARVIVGLPCHLDGSEGELAKAARSFADQLGHRTHCPVTLWNEALSTEAAREALAEERRRGNARRGGRSRLNAEAARTILEGWLEQALRAYTDNEND
jgi:putative Holliday junction resolvase